MHRALAVEREGQRRQRQVLDARVVERLEDAECRGLRRLGDIAHVGDGRFLYSGGIGSVEHLQALRALELENLAGVVSGKALYERRFGLGEGAEALA